MAKISMLRGTVPVEVRTAILQGKGCNAKTLHNDIQRNLHKIGSYAKREYCVKDRGDGHTGRIDLIVRFKGQIIGIEIDRMTPRKKSIYKLKDNFENFVIATRE